jgi:hypothetical protein
MDLNCEKKKDDAYTTLLKRVEALENETNRNRTPKKQNNLVDPGSSNTVLLVFG